MAETSTVASCSEAEMSAVLDLLPQKPPFLFLDKITELSLEHIVAQYRFKQDEFFYKGHFPGDPVTPGVILVEAMAQAALVALGIYILSKEQPTSNIRTLFTDCQVEFSKVVRPHDLVTITAKRVYWRRLKLQSEVIMRLDDGSIAASGLVSGIGVKVG